jgi:hypothetical protein
MTKGGDELSSPGSSCSGGSSGKKKIHSVVTKQGASNLVLERGISKKVFSMSEPLYSQNLTNKKEVVEEEDEALEKLA